MRHLTRSLYVTGAVRHVEVSLVERDSLHLHGVIVPDRSDLARHLAVLFKIGMHVYATRTKPVRFLYVHGRMDAVLTSLIIAGRDYAALGRK